MLKNRLIQFLFLLSFSLLVSFAKAQDPQFSQFYANPLYLNPAFAGATECARINLNYRNQWPSLTKAYITYSITYDQSLNSINSGFGIIAINDRQGDGALNTTLLGAIYAYNLQVSEGLFIRFGAQAVYYQQRLDWDKLIFADQINPINGTISNITNQTPPENTNIGVADFSVGTVLTYNDQFFVGFTADHLTQPSLSFYDNNDDKLPLKYTAHGGVTINLSRGMLGGVYGKDFSIQPQVLYMRQQDFQQLNAGLYLNRNPFVIGAWFRHNFENPDAVIILVGLSFKNIKFGYSYDMGVSRVGGEALGAHEVSFAWDFCIYNDKKRKIRAIKTPLF
ncbi:MAG: type IX secretion system membrane protein PorP/SprF [Bacteroidetes bacterium]|nr:type IX secretion system membrane protein PorP/SprF [Bacteroidota bacterium]